ncbi:MAG: hypothetical protein SPI30_05995 [Prevotella sp.]|nr:hypothetical protein [Prevotella sp.]
METYKKKFLITIGLSALVGVPYSLVMPLVWGENTMPNWVEPAIFGTIVVIISMLVDRHFSKKELKK